MLSYAKDIKPLFRSTDVASMNLADWIWGLIRMCVSGRTISSIASLTGRCPVTVNGTRHRLISSSSGSPTENCPTRL